MGVHSSQITEVAVKGFTWSAAAGWSTFLLIAGALGALARAIGPAKLYETWTSRDNLVRGEQAGAAARKVEREDALERRVEVAEKRLVYITGALAILLNDANDGPAMKQAMAMLSMAEALGGADEFAISIRKMLENLT